MTLAQLALKVFKVRLVPSDHTDLLVLKELKDRRGTQAQLVLKGSKVIRVNRVLLVLRELRE